MLLAPLLLSTALSAWMLEVYIHSPGGYAAVYAGVGALIFAGDFALVGLALLGLKIGLKKRHWLGVSCLVAALWLQIVFKTGVKVSSRLGLVAWENEPKIDLLADDGLSYYIYFQPGTSAADIERLTAELDRNIQSFARMPAIGGREVVRIGLPPNLTSAQILDFLVDLKKQSVVSEVSNHRPQQP